MRGAFPGHSFGATCSFTFSDLASLVFSSLLSPILVRIMAAAGALWLGLSQDPWSLFTARTITGIAAAGWVAISVMYASFFDKKISFYIALFFIKTHLFLEAYRTKDQFFINVSDLWVFFPLQHDVVTTYPFPSVFSSRVRNHKSHCNDNCSMSLYETSVSF